MSDNIAWAMQQDCPSPLAKLLLIRIASGIGESGRETFWVSRLESFAGCGFRPLFEALEALYGAGLLQNLGAVGDFDVALALPWYSKPDKAAQPKRALQGLQRVRDGLTRLQDGRCWYCGCNLSECASTPHVEHQTPLSRGGADDLSNLVMACGRCNTDKGDKTLEEYRLVVMSRESASSPVDEAGCFAGERWT